MDAAQLSHVLTNDGPPPYELVLERLATSGITWAVELARAYHSQCVTEWEAAETLLYRILSTRPSSSTAASSLVNSASLALGAWCWRHWQLTIIRSKWARHDHHILCYSDTDIATLRPQSSSRCCAGSSSSVSSL